MWRSAAGTTRPSSAGAGPAPGGCRSSSYRMAGEAGTGPRQDLSGGRSSSTARPVGAGSGHSKKEAEQAAAEVAARRGRAGGDVNRPIGRGVRMGRPVLNGRPVFTGASVRAAMCGNMTGIFRAWPCYTVPMQVLSARRGNGGRIMTWRRVEPLSLLTVHRCWASFRALAEFLPISSSGHLAIAEHLLG